MFRCATDDAIFRPYPDYSRARSKAEITKSCCSDRVDLRVAPLMEVMDFIAPFPQRTVARSAKNSISHRLYLPGRVDSITGFNCRANERTVFDFL